MFNYTASYTDFYQLTMSQVYFLKGQKEADSVFDYSFRRLPFNGGYAIFAGLSDLLEILETLAFSKNDLDFLKLQGFHPDFIKYLETFRFNGNIYSICEGNIVTVDHPLVEIETDKATTDIPSPFEGTIKEILVKEGEEVKVQQVIMIIDVSDNKEAQDKKTKTEVNRNHNNKLKTESLLSEEQRMDDITENSLSTGQIDLSSIPASLLARKTAREQGVDITKLEGTGPKQRITRHDVENYINQKSRTIETTEKNSEETTIGREKATYKPMNNIRKLFAKNMEESWRTIPHVTQFDESDITLIKEFRKGNMEEIASSGGKLTITALLVKIVGFALQRFQNSMQVLTCRICR